MLDTAHSSHMFISHCKVRVNRRLSCVQLRVAAREIPQHGHSQDRMANQDNMISSRTKTGQPWSPSAAAALYAHWRILNPPAKWRSSKVSSFGRGPGVVTRGKLLALDRVTLTPSHSSHSSSPVQPQARCSNTWFFSAGGALLVGCRTDRHTQQTDHTSARQVDKRMPGTGSHGCSQPQACCSRTWVSQRTAAHC
jgi:hypothetical protein